MHCHPCCEKSQSVAVAVALRYFINIQHPSPNTLFLIHGVDDGVDIAEQGLEE